MNAKTIKMIGLVMSVIGFLATGASDMITEVYTRKEIDEQIALAISKRERGEQ